MSAARSKAAPNKLGRFEGRDVLGAGIEIRNAAGGLNEAMKVDPEEWHIGEEIHVVMRGVVSKVRHDPLKDTDGLRRVHVITASDATVVEPEFVEAALDEQAQRIEEAQGIQRLEVAKILTAAHNAGEHDRAVADCPVCEAESA